MFTLLIWIWRCVRWIPGTFYVSQIVYSRRFRKFPRLQPLPTQDVSEFSLLYIAPENELAVENFKPGGGSVSYEIFQSASERYGSGKVHLSGERILTDIAKLNSLSQQYNVTHVLLNPENPDSPEEWLLPEVLNALSATRPIKFLFVMKDAVHWDHIFKVNHLSKFVSRSTTLAIDVEIGSRLSARSKAAGPACLPISRATMDTLPQNPCSSQKLNGISFLGKLYDYRAKQLEKIPSDRLQVNPHRIGEGLPSYATYLTSLWSSVATVNFAQASSYRKKQLKSRVLEAAIMGCPVITDDGGKAATYLGSEDLVVTIKWPQRLLPFIKKRQAIEKALKVNRAELMKTSRAKASDYFWEMFEAAG